MKRSVAEKEFRFYKENTKDFNKLNDDIRMIMQHKNFTYHKQKPTLTDLKIALNSGSVCEVVLDARTLDRKKAFSLHS